MSPLVIAITALGGLLLILLWQATATTIRCPQCAGVKPEEMQREFRETRDAGIAGLTTQQDFQIIVDVHYRCQQCGHEWKRAEIDR